MKFYAYIIYVCLITYTEKVKTGLAQPTEFFISSNSTSCNSMEIILPVDMNNIGNYILFGFSYYIIQTLVVNELSMIIILLLV